VIGPAQGGAIMAFEAARSPLDMGPNPGPVGVGEAIPYMPSCNLLVRRALLGQLGGFDPAMPIGEDVDLIWRGRAQGARAFYAPAGAVVHHHRARLGSFARRRAFYARSEVDLLRRHPQSRRTMQLPLTALLALAALTALPLSLAASAALAGLLLLGLAWELIAKRRRLGGAGIRLPPAAVGRALLRGHTAALHHLGVNVLRYYSLPLLGAATLWPPLLPPLLLLALAPPLVDFSRLRPALGLPLFIALYWVELSAYQLGIWAGCLRYRTLLPLLPRLRLAR
jgi:mycofactocin glycosyltransferase